ncbi:glycosyltransferase [Methylobacterium sp. J-092]|uniref:glycosyltransferase n=1 Tax=Methylobacterium sp. J-092 TaxID=2836667 RepID=UPI001FBAE082|nr:glycosyltransferase [Methylobacterium sp. J-092]MCJ2006812.1 glycosyltransferase [Methylobacterium sp. J-092]
MQFDLIAKLRKNNLKKRQLIRDKKIVSESNFFDRNWYLDQYPEIKLFSGTPLDHFMEYGVAEGRAAGPHFDTFAYTNANPDVLEAGQNPLVHYIQNGEKEGRRFRALDPNKSNQNINNSGIPKTFSIIVNDSLNPHLRLTIDSLISQTGIFCEILLPETCDIDSFDRAMNSNKRRFSDIKLIKHMNGTQFAREAIIKSTFDVIIFLDAGDALAEFSLYKISNLFNSTCSDIIYTDETQSLRDGSNFSMYLKPSWSPEMLSSFNYFGHCTAIRRELAADVVLSKTFEIGDISTNSWEWNLCLQASSRASTITRLPESLCHRIRTDSEDIRLHDTSIDEGRNVLKQYWSRRGHIASVSRVPDGTFFSTWEPQNNPLVSIIIPNKNHADLLRMCIEGLFGNTSYRNFEIIIVDNESTDEETITLYNSLIAKSVRIIPFNETFNYSRACNLGAKHARGEMLLFLNNDIQIVQGDWLKRLVCQACEPGVGVVGAKLLYPDGDVQHAGVALGLFTLAAHVFHRTPPDRWGLFCSSSTQRNWSAVTGACQIVRRSIFDLVCGYDEGFSISYSDVVLCLDIARMGFRCVYLPSAVLVHHEGASRGTMNPQTDQILFAKRLRSLGIAYDPFFHPQLDVESFDPKVSDNFTDNNQLKMQEDIQFFCGSTSDVVDPYDFGAVAAAAKLPWDVIAWPFHPIQMQPGLLSATRIILEFICRRRDLRKLFPTAIRDGAQGGLAHWIKTKGLYLLGLGDEYASWIDVAFDSNNGAKSLQILMNDLDFRQENPLFLLPQGRAASCARLFNAWMDGDTTLEDVWWFLITTAESPQTALSQTWACTPSWQTAVADGGTVFGIMCLLEWVDDNYGLQDHEVFTQDYPCFMSDAAQVRLAYFARSDWQDQFPLAMLEEANARALLAYLTKRASGLSFLARGWVEARQRGTLAIDIVRRGINILGHFAYPSGLRISTESLVEGLRENNIVVSARDVPVSISTDDPLGFRFQGHEIYDTTLIHVQPEPLFDVVFERAGLRARSNKTYRIGYWYWEFDEIPASWNRAALQCDEIWAATHFIANGLRRRYRQPIFVMPPGIEMPDFQQKPRSYFNIPSDEFVFTFVFHMTSVMDRKNPLGLIKAFHHAFSTNDRVRLVIKTSFGDRYPDSLAALVAATSDTRVNIIDAVFTRDETLSLINCSDAYISLHRSEGLGLTLAEAMLLEKPVIATRYSGNVDFMTDKNSLLVDYRLVQLDRDIEPYKAGLQWAEPSVEHAAALMRKLFSNPDIALKIGRQAKRDIEHSLNYRLTGRLIADRLAAIELL